LAIQIQLINCTVLKKALGFILLLTLGIVFASVAQNFNNTWINYGQPYLRIELRQDGLYQVSYEAIKAAGFPVDSTPADELQLFFRGKEVAILVASGSDNLLQAGEHIMFYGQENIGDAEAQLLATPAWTDIQPHTPLYSNRTAYFLTASTNGAKGLRVREETNGPAAATQTAVTANYLFAPTNQFSSGTRYPLAQTSLNSGTLLSNFEGGVGYSGTAFSDEITYNLSLPNYIATGQNVDVSLQLTGRNYSPLHIVEILAGPSENELSFLKTATYKGYNSVNVSLQLTPDLLDEGGSFVLKLQSRYTAAEESYFSSYGIYPPKFSSLGEAFIKYPATASSSLFSNNALTFTASASSAVKLPSAVNYAWDISDARSIVQKKLNAAAVNVQAGKKYLATTAVRSVAGEDFWLFDAKMKRPASSNTNYVIISHEHFRQPAGGYTDPVAAYAEYRATPAGGGYSVADVNVQELYDQFTYGEVNPQAIREYARFLNSYANPKAMLFLGSGRDLNLKDEFDRYSSSDGYYRSWIPPYGFPSTDLLYTAGLSNSNNPVEASIPIGRISANKPEEIASYLNKVKEYQSYSYTNLWKKKILHLSGGGSDNELITIRRYVDNHKLILEQEAKWGPKVESIYKIITNGVQEVNLSDELNEGVNFVQLFGHSSPNFFDMNIGYLEEGSRKYTNQPFYPMMLANGCDVGFIWRSNREVLSENWVNTPNKGAIGMISSSQVAFISILNDYTKSFYEIGLGNEKLISGRFGDLLNSVNKYAYENHNNKWLIESYIQQLVYQGDPAIVLFEADKPDYALNTSDVVVESVEKDVLFASADSIAITIPIINLGLSTTKKVSLVVERQYPNGTTATILRRTIDPIDFEKNLQIIYYQAPEEKSIAGGQNNFIITIDTEDELIEMSETNNSISVPVLFQQQPITVSLPLQHAITGRDTVDVFLKAIPDAVGELYSLEVATDAIFSNVVYQHQGEARVNTFLPVEIEQLIYADTSVFYVRARLVNSEVYATTDFTYINDKNGWSQSEIQQFENNDFSGSSFIDNAEYTFNSNNVNLDIFTTGANPSTTETYEIQINDTVVVASGACSPNALTIMEISGVTGEILAPERGEWFWGFSAPLCGSGFPGSAVSFNEEYSAYRNWVGNHFLKPIPEGNYIIMYLSGNLNINRLDRSFYSHIGGFGLDIQEFREKIKSGDPFIFFGRKGMAPGEGTAIYADPTSDIPTSEQRLEASFSFDIDINAAEMRTDLIGPAKNWEQININLGQKDSNAEKAEVLVEGVTTSGASDSLMILRSGERDISNLNSQQYPFLRLTYKSADAENKTPVQLNSWHVFYEPVAEGVLVPANNTEYSASWQQVEEGDSIRAAWEFANISPTNFADSIQVVYRLLNGRNGKVEEKIAYLPPLASGETAPLYFSNSSFGWSGETRLVISVNPRILPEQRYDNNVAEVRYQVVEDKTNPLLNVLFDGRRIMNGDIVSAEPTITIHFADKNKFNVVTDTTAFELYMSLCEDCSLTRVPLNSPAVNLEQSESGELTLQYQPDALPDGVYRLKANGVDGNGNTAGEAYEVVFEVVSEASITNFYPYPNPFSNHVQFVFTLTGTEVPEDILIRIMTPTGRVVKEITMDELGSIHVGNNTSQYAWDGKDQYGDELANGVYLYEVLIKSSNDEAYTHRNTAGDGMFKNGIGKMYKIR
jgi:hypothetical protein